MNTWPTLIRMRGRWGPPQPEPHLAASSRRDRARPPYCEIQPRIVRTGCAPARLDAAGPTAGGQANLLLAAGRTYLESFLPCHPTLTVLPPWPPRAFLVTRDRGGHCPL